ncbi:MAG: oligosaccharide flippase family protein [Muribaculaceae bacterium]|nr:oligosaccharide flippase family protein [Muribaculaceae bacterium]
MTKANVHKSATTQKILKVLSVFGGVQAVGILCSVVRTKLAALWLGPAGVGLMAIYNSTMDLLAKTSQLNLDQSAVRDIAMVRSDAGQTASVVAAVRKLSRTIGIVCTLLAALCSPLISEVAFGDRSHTLAFAALSLWIFFAIMTNGEYAVLRGLDRLRPMAKASLWAAVVSIVLAVPLLYFLRIDAVVPLFLVYYGVQWAFAMRFRARDISRVRITLKQAWRSSRDMLRLGAYMTLSNTVTLLASGAFVIYLNRSFGEDTVGIYQSGYTLINTYVGIIFTAIVMEYYPRLSTVIAHRRRTEVVVSHEIKVAQCVLMPVAVAFICCSPLVIRILYTSAFEAALPYVAVGASGVFFRAASWCVAYTILARGDGRIFVVTELASAVVYLALHIPLFATFGFKGLGVAYVLWYGIYFAVVWAVYRYRYGLRLRPGIALLTLGGFAAALLTLAACALAGPWITLPAVLLPAAWFAFRSLR